MRPVVDAARGLRFAVPALTALFALPPSAAPAQSIGRALDERGSPQQLEFLRGVSPGDRLARAIERDVRTLPPDAARASVVNRFRLDLFAEGAFDPTILAQRGGATGRTPPARVFDNLESVRSDLRERARRDARPAAGGPLAAAVPAEQVVRMAVGTYQTNGGWDVATDGRQQRPPRLPGAVAATTGNAASPLGRPVIIAPQQTVPGRDTNGDRIGDCHIPFDRLQQQCAAREGQRCERYDSTQFQEVVKVRRGGEGGPICTGTLIGGRWVLSAAHCFLPQESAAAFASGRPGRRLDGEIVVAEGELRGWELVFEKAFDLPSPARIRSVRRVFIHRDWTPAPRTLVSLATLAQPGDLALIEIPENERLPTDKVVPAVLVDRSYSGPVTTAGYGLTTTDLEPRFAVTWPRSPVTVAGDGQLGTDRPQASTFCRGDSGGPAFIGRQRGCPLNNLTGKEAPFPRPLAGVASYHSDLEISANDAQSCMAVRIGRFMDLGAPVHRDWICRVTRMEAAGCVPPR